MKRHIYRGIATILVFVAALIFFTMRIRPVTYRLETELTQMAEASLPIVHYSRGGYLLNLRHGYVSEAACEPIRDHVMPLGEADAVVLQIETRGLGVEAIRVKVSDANGVPVFETEDENATWVDTETAEGPLRVAVQFPERLEAGQDYRSVIVLQLENGRQIYYPAVLRFAGADHYKENIAFTERFRRAAMAGLPTVTERAATQNEADAGTADNSQPALNLSTYLETERYPEANTLSYVNIHSTAELVRWEGFSAAAVSAPEIRITENNAATTGVSYDYLVWGTDGTIYDVDEYFRVQYTEATMYLLSYERHMTAREGSTAGNTIARIPSLETTAADTIFTYMTNTEKTRAALVRDHALWYYDIENQEVTYVYSFLNATEKGINDAADRILDHEIRILRMEENGDFYFVVSGYMNRGIYEGQIAICLYRFVADECRIEEQVLIPVEEPYLFVKDELSEFTYLSAEQYFYFSVSDKIYAYSLVRKELSVICDHVSGRSLLFMPDQNLLVWQAAEDVAENESLILYNPELRTEEMIPAKEGQIIRMLGGISDNLVYGFADAADIYESLDGTRMIPCDEIRIADVHGRVLKSYAEPGFYVTGIKVEDNLMHLYRVQKNDAGAFEAAEEDQIQNQAEVSRRTGIKETVSSYARKEAAITVITAETTVRAGGESARQKGYAGVLYGAMTAFDSQLSEQIGAADAAMGYVIDENGRVIWQRGVTASSAYLSDAETALRGGEIDARGQTLEDVLPGLKEAYGSEVLDLVDIPFQTAMYYVTMGTPVLAERKNDSPIVIIGYDNTGITYYNCGNGGLYALGREQAERTLRQAGNHYLCFIPAFQE